METSDSENFESADEDFNFEGAVSETTKKEGKNDKPIVNKKNVNFCDTQKDTHQDKPSREIDDCESKAKAHPEPRQLTGNKINTQSTKSTKKIGKKLGQKLISDKLEEKISGTKSGQNETCKSSPETDVCIKEFCDKSIEDVTNTSSKVSTEVAGEDFWGDSEIGKAQISPLNTSPKEFNDKSYKDDKSVTEDDLWGDTEIDWGVESKLNKDFQEKCSVGVEPVADAIQSANSGWGDWGGWNVSSILSTATQGVSSITNHVSHGLNTVLESGIGVPDPEEMARINVMDKQKELVTGESKEEIKPHEENQNFGLGFGLGNFVKFVETTGTKVISGGLGTLETIGKKTMEVLQEGDPGLKKKRAFLQLNQDKPNLSQILREAKEKAEKENRSLEERHSSRNTKNYESYFDDHQGLVHLEALELLSKQCGIKLQTILDNNSGDALVELQETLDQVKELCELPDEDEDEQLSLSDVRDKLSTAVADMGIPISYEKLLLNWEETDQWLNSLKPNICTEKELHQQAIETLARLTAQAVEQFHKAGELLLIKEHRSTADEADSLVQLTITLTSFIGTVAGKFSEKLNSIGASASSEEAVNSLITNVFFEAGNSSTYIQDAFQLLIPVLQAGAV